MKLILLSLLLATNLWALPDLPSPPQDPTHPGSKIYPFEVDTKKLTCSGRDVFVYSPRNGISVPAVVYGHGQALSLPNYEETLKHLAGKGVAGIYVTYDKGFFDQDWERMGRDFVLLTDCALKQFPQILREEIIFSGHSKGAYVAAIAAGVAQKENLPVRASSLILFNPVLGKFETLKDIPAATPLTVVHSDTDKIVKLEVAREMLVSVSSDKEQLIILQSFRNRTKVDLEAGHFWPLTKKSAFGGGPVSSFHHYGSWKWLVGGALDERFLYGPEASDKGLEGFQDIIERNF
jgi:hypothetical protein